MRRDPFADKVIPASRLDPAGLKAASFYPPPRGGGLACKYVYAATFRRGLGLITLETRCGAFPIGQVFRDRRSHRN